MIAQFFEDVKYHLNAIKHKLYNEPEKPLSPSLTHEKINDDELLEEKLKTDQSNTLSQPALNEPVQTWKSQIDSYDKKQAPKGSKMEQFKEVVMAKLLHPGDKETKIVSSETVNHCLEYDD